MTHIKDAALDLALGLRELADRFSEGWHDGIKIDASDIMLLSQAADTIEQALLEQPEPVQEPVAWPCVIVAADFEQKTITLEMQSSYYKVRAGQYWLHTTPPAQTAVPLTDEEIVSAKFESYDFALNNGSTANKYVIEFARAIEAKLREKNAPTQGETK
jgi:hypothetical protein